MNRVYDKESIIKLIQKYLIFIDEGDIGVSPNGIYDDITRLAVRKFQENQGLEVTGIVNEATMSSLADEYLKKQIEKQTRMQNYPFIRFPILQGDRSDGLIQIHQAMAKVLNYYGHTHRIRETGFYNEQTALAVNLLREIYLLEADETIDELFYFRLMNDLKSINLTEII